LTRPPTAPRGPTRRELLGGALALAACTRPVRAPGRRFEQPIIIDVHCHDFNASDLPITGFIARTIPGLTELTRGVTPIPSRSCAGSWARSTAGSTPRRPAPTPSCR
jgi:hypothetical protein